MVQAKIVVTDDDPDIRDSLKAILEARGHTVVTAASREEGMATIRNEKPDLAILDVMMSTWQDGFEMARELKADPEMKGTPLLMLTGVKEQTGVDVKSSAGDPTWLPVDGFLDKPIQPARLLSEVERLLGD
jgi:CheY-like chemotaxis protein